MEIGIALSKVCRQRQLPCIYGQYLSGCRLGASRSALPVIALTDRSQIERVVFRDCEPNRSAVHSLPKSLKHQWFIYSSA